MTHTTTVRDMPANENGRGNLAGFEIRCSRGFTATTTLATAVQGIRRDHIEFMAKSAASDKRARKEVAA